MYAAISAAKYIFDFWVAFSPGPCNPLFESRLHYTQTNASRWQPLRSALDLAIVTGLGSSAPSLTTQYDYECGGYVGGYLSISERSLNRKLEKSFGNDVLGLNSPSQEISTQLLLRVPQFQPCSYMCFPAQSTAVG
jgi:hypothetical protein